MAEARESLRLAFVAALQHLPPRQRAVLILREVLRWQATEVAELLDTSVASVNSALQRARATLDALDLDATPAAAPVDAEQQELLARYVDAFERYDIDLAGLAPARGRDVLHAAVPPLAAGPERGRAASCSGRASTARAPALLATRANGGPAVALYHPRAGRHEPWAIVVVETSDGRIAGLHHFLYPELFAEFGLPPRLDR